MGKINIYQEAERCLLCQDAPCGTKVADATSPAATAVTRPLRLKTANLAYWATSA
jgi:hypothetical protein